MLSWGLSALLCSLRRRGPNYAATTQLCSPDHLATAHNCRLQSPRTPTDPVMKRRPLDVSEGSTVCCNDSTGTNTSIFFARVPPMVPDNDLLQLFSRFGTVKDLNLFRRWATAKTSKGCGTVQYSKPEEASAAMRALNGVFMFEGFSGCEGSMVVEWMDASRLTAPSDAAGGWVIGRLLVPAMHSSTGVLVCLMVQVCSTGPCV